MASLQEVARAAGVSISTVSRAISRPDMVNADTRERVDSAVRELGYRPSRVARRLRVARGLSDLVGLVIPDLQNPFFADLARGVEDVAARYGYTVLIGNSDESIERETRYLNAMMAEAVDGIILPPSCEAARLRWTSCAPACRWSAWIAGWTRRRWTPSWWTTSAAPWKRPNT
jgi:LacI family transcriptional regulator/LacI family repressor for deo operon, udp, cdd, tsx, nupC, and nupG